MSVDLPISGDFPTSGDLPTVGLVGLGRMGSAIGKRLIDQGYPLVVHNRTAARAEALLAAGAAWAATPAEVCVRGDLVLTVLFDERAVNEVYLGEDGLVQAARPGALLVEMSTIRVATTTAVAQAAGKRGMHLIDAALAGPPAAALAGRLLVLAGGDAADVARAAPLLNVLSRDVVHLGATGSGVAMKLVLMHTMAVYFAGLAEALTSGLSLGLAPRQMLAVILDSHGAPPVLHDRAEALLGELQGRSGPVGFPVAGVRKDLEAVSATVMGEGGSAPVADAALALFKAAEEGGFAERDLVAVAAYFAQASRRSVSLKSEPSPGEGLEE